jgi:hypothetical protein
VVNGKPVKIALFELTFILLIYFQSALFKRLCFKIAEKSSPFLTDRLEVIENIGAGDRIEPATSSLGKSCGIKDPLSPRRIVHSPADHSRYSFGSQNSPFGPAYASSRIMMGSTARIRFIASPGEKLLAYDFDSWRLRGHAISYFFSNIAMAVTCFPVASMV